MPAAVAHRRTAKRKPGVDRIDPKQSGLANVVVPLFSLVAGIAFICACWFHIKAKGRSAWWILVLALNLLGIVMLALLKDHATGGEKEVA